MKKTLIALALSLGICSAAQAGAADDSMTNLLTTKRPSVELVDQMALGVAMVQAIEPCGMRVLAKARAALAPHTSDATPRNTARQIFVRMSAPCTPLDTDIGRSKLRSLDLTEPAAGQYLGLHYLRTGEPALAEYWLQRAADRGVATADLFLGQMHSNLSGSFGVPYQPELAKVHLARAAASGSVLAKNALRLLD